MGSLKRIFKDRVIRLTTAIMLVQTLVFPIILYGQKPGLSKRQIGKHLVLLNYGDGGNFSELPT